jgi:hypothetical protein
MYDPTSSRGTTRCALSFLSLANEESSISHAIYRRLAERLSAWRFRLMISPPNYEERHPEEGEEPEIYPCASSLKVETQAGVEEAAIGSDPAHRWWCD